MTASAKVTLPEDRKEREVVTHYLYETFQTLYDRANGSDVGAELDIGLPSDPEVCLETVAMLTRVSIALTDRAKELMGTKVTEMDSGTKGDPPTGGPEGTSFNP